MIYDEYRLDKPEEEVDGMYVSYYDGHPVRISVSDGQVCLFLEDLMNVFDAPARERPALNARFHALRGIPDPEPAARTPLQEEALDTALRVLCGDDADKEVRFRAWYDRTRARLLGDDNLSAVRLTGDRETVRAVLELQAQAAASYAATTALLSQALGLVTTGKER